MAAAKTTLQRLDQFLALKDKDGIHVDHWINDDIRPMPPSRRTWSGATYFVYNIGVSILFVQWTAASSLLSYGMTVGECIAVVLIGQGLVGILCCLAVGIGADWHIGFPVINRFAWGMRGNWFPIVNRVVLGMTWFAVESWYGGTCLKLAIGAIWPSFYNVPNHFPADLGMETIDFACWIIFLGCCVPLIFFRPENMMYPSIVVVCMVALTTVIMLGWFVTKAHGGGVLLNNPGAFLGIQPVYGSALGWKMVLGITTQISGIAQGLLGFADWGRYAKSPLGAKVFFPLGMFLGTVYVAITGLVVSSCAATIYSDVKVLLWNPALVLYELHESSGARAAVFFGGISFMLSQYLLTVSGCNLIGGLDLSGVFPRWVNIKRGGFIVMVIGMVMQPWSLLNGASVFLTVMSSYGIFLAPLTGIMHSDYYIVRRRKISLIDLYTHSHESSFWFWHGVNWRAVVSFIIGSAFLYPGFVAAVRGTEATLAPGWLHLYYLTYPLGYTLAGTVHWTLSTVFPPSDLRKVDDEDVYGTFADRPSAQHVESGTPLEPESVDDEKKEDLSGEAVIRVLEA